MKRLIYCLSICLTLLACETDLDIPFPEHEAKLTLNGFLVEDGEFFLYVTRSFSALEDVGRANDSLLVIRDADVSLWRDGERLTDLVFIEQVPDTLIDIVDGMLDTVIYPIPARVFRPEQELPAPKAGETYEYRVSHPEYGMATAQVTVVAAPRVVKVEFIEDSLTSTDFDGYQDRWSVLKVTIDDPNESAAYYNFSYQLTSVNRYQIDGQAYADTGIYTGPAFTELVRDGAGTVWGTSEPISDADFNGQRSTLLGWMLLPGSSGYPGDLSNDEQETLELSVNVFALNQEFGLYQQKRTLQIDSRTEGIESAFLPREPVSVPGNVEGGYGLVGSFNAVQVEVEL